MGNFLQKDIKSYKKYVQNFTARRVESCKAHLCDGSRSQNHCECKIVYACTYSSLVACVAGVNAGGGGGDRRGGEEKERLL